MTKTSRIKILTLLGAVMMAACEPCQVRNEAALSNASHVSLLAWLFFYLPELGMEIAVDLAKGNQLRINDETGCTTQLTAAANYWDVCLSSEITKLGSSH